MCISILSTFNRIHSSTYIFIDIFIHIALISTFSQFWYKVDIVFFFLLYNNENINGFVLYHLQFYTFSYRYTGSRDFSKYSASGMKNFAFIFGTAVIPARYQRGHKSESLFRMRDACPQGPMRPLLFQAHLSSREP